MSLVFAESIGHRFRTIHDFGFVVLDILYVYPEDSGEYVCKATNKYGQATTTARLNCRGIGFACFFFILFHYIVHIMPMYLCLVLRQ